MELVFGAERRDVYGRLLAYVHLGDRFVNAILVRRGLARTLTIPPNDRYAPVLHELEAAAARAGRGLWGACRPQNPAARLRALRHLDRLQQDVQLWYGQPQAGRPPAHFYANASKHLPVRGRLRTGDITGAPPA
jgi:micrococcal nuclease